jgi:hypothetical protein
MTDTHEMEEESLIETLRLRNYFRQTGSRLVPFSIYRRFIHLLQILKRLDSFPPHMKRYVDILLDRYEEEHYSELNEKDQTQCLLTLGEVERTLRLLKQRGRSTTGWSQVFRQVPFSKF